MIPHTPFLSPNPISLHLLSLCIIALNHTTNDTVLTIVLNILRGLKKRVVCPDCRFTPLFHAIARRGGGTRVFEYCVVHGGIFMKDPSEYKLLFDVVKESDGDGVNVGRIKRWSGEGVLELEGLDEEEDEIEDVEIEEEGLDVGEIVSREFVIVD
jgi:hypothetical protein